MELALVSVNPLSMPILQIVQHQKSDKKNEKMMGHFEVLFIKVRE